MLGHGEQKVTKSFKWKEFVVSRQFPELAAQINLSEIDKIKIWFLVSMILQPLRDFLDRKIVILSGKRSTNLNAMVGGTATSDHLFHNVSVAVDFTVLGTNGEPSSLLLEEALNWLKDFAAIGQVIWYKKELFIHVSLPTPKHFRDFSVRE